MTLDRILLTVQQAFDENPNPVRPDDAILKLLSLTLYKNDFEFNGQFYLQLCGVAMGRKYAPSTANLYLKELDHAAMYRCHIHPSYTPDSLMISLAYGPALSPNYSPSKNS